MQQESMPLNTDWALYEERTRHKDELHSMALKHYEEVAKLREEMAKQREEHLLREVELRVDLAKALARLEAMSNKPNQT